MFKKNSFILKVALLILILHGYNWLNAQKMYMIDGLVFEQYNHEHGLSDNYILSFKKDSNDFIWLGTTKGLNILDGKEVKLFKGYQNENNHFKGRFVTSIFEDSKSNVFCGTKKYGLNIYNRLTGQFKNINDELLANAKSKAIKSIIEISNLQYVLLTEQEIIYFNLDENNNITETSILNILLHEKEYTLKLLIYKNEMYLNTNKRLLKVKDNNLSLIYSNKWLKGSKIRNDRFWVMNESNIGYFSENLKHVHWIDYKIIKNTKYNTDYYLDFDIAPGNKEIWIGAKHQLIYLKLKDNTVVSSSQEYETKVEIRGITIDNLQNIFIRTNKKQGLIKVNSRQHQYTYVKLPDGFETEYRHKYTEDNNGNYWISGNTGVFVYDKKTKTYSKFKDGSYKGLPNLKINDQIKDKYGKLWFGTSNGIAHFNPVSNSFNFTGHNLEDYLDSFTHHLQLDQNSNLWYVTNNRLNKIDNANNNHEFFDFKGIDAIFIDSENTLWVTSRNKGLEKYSIKTGGPEFKKKYFISEEFMDYISHQIIDDKFGRLWIVTVNGIYVYDINKENVVFHINKNNLLKNEALYGITPDNRGNFWVSQFLAPSLCISSETFEVIETSPNWMRMEGNTDLFASPIDIEDDGTIFTEGIGGFFVYHPDSLKINNQPTKMVLQEVNLNGTKVLNNFLGLNTLKFEDLNYTENNLDLKLKAVNPEISYFTLYAYRLLGNSNEWQFSKELKTINYSSLKPNNYQLQVKSTNNGSIWSEPLTLATFDILPPWWKTTLAYIIYLILFTAIIYAFYKIQLNKKLAVSEANQLKQLDDFKNKFYQNITHEFRTPLTVIIGMAESLESKVSEMVKRNAQQLLNLVNELLEIGKIESNSANLELSTKDIVAFTKYCMESLESLAKQKDIKLKFSSPPNSILMDFDIDKVQLILNNLLSNAIKFTPKNGSVDVTVKALNEIVEIKVSDSGSGISEDNLERIFDRYFQEKNNKSSTGSGLGLALSRELVRLMNGTIKAENNKENGACFTVTLPLNNTLKIQNSQSITVKYKLEDAIENDENVVLVIEDNEDVLTYISSVLEPSYKVYSAPNGKLGFEKALELIPDLIISDVMMPVMDGYEACHLIKSDFRTDHIPVIMLTAKVDHDSKISGLKLGADVYLGKPFNKEELLVHINNLISIRENLKKKYNSENGNLDNTQTPKISNEFLSKISEVLLNNISDDAFGINEICKEIGVSRTQLHRKLKALTGLSTSKFIREIRLNEGYKLIKNTDLNISEIAYSIGFSDPNYFSKLFTEKFQTPPSRLEK